jgi:hypothetical protein
MELNNTIQGSNDNSLLFCSMREMLLTENSAPLNVDAFYHQFFDYNKITPIVKHQIELAKNAWVNIADSHVVYLDKGITKDVYDKITKLENSGIKIIYQFLQQERFQEKVNHINEMRCVDDVVAFLDENKDILSLNGYRVRKIMMAAEKKYANHLPETFKTFNIDYSEVQNNNGIPTRCIVESPFAGEIETNVEYAASVISELILNHNKAPMASHLLYTRMLHDDDSQERLIGIDAGLEYGRHAEETIICVDRGISNGMKYGVINAEKSNRLFSFFTLSKDTLTKKEVSEIKTVEELEIWCKKQINKNPARYYATGFVTDCNQKHKISSNIT